MIVLSFRHRPGLIDGGTSLLLLAAPAQAGTVTGEACFPAETALPADAVSELVIEDISRADTPARVLARRRITPPGAAAHPLLHPLQRRRGGSTSPLLDPHHGSSTRPTAVFDRYRPPCAGRKREVCGGESNSGAEGSKLTASPPAVKPYRSGSSTSSGEPAPVACTASFPTPPCVHPGARVTITELGTDDGVGQPVLLPTLVSGAITASPVPTWQQGERAQPGRGARSTTALMGDALFLLLL